MIRLATPSLNDPALGFIHNGDSETDVLRGGPFYQTMSRFGWTVLYGASLPDPRHLPERLLLRVTIPTNPVVAYALGIARQSRTHVVIIDVQFPFFDPDQITGSDQAVRYWAYREHRETAEMVLRNADALTIPWPDWAAEMVDYNSNVYILPDLQPGYAALRDYAQLLEQIWRVTLQQKGGV